MWTNPILNIAIYFLLYGIGSIISRKTKGIVIEALFFKHNLCNRLHHRTVPSGCTQRYRYSGHDECIRSDAYNNKLRHVN